MKRTAQLQIVIAIAIAIAMLMLLAASAAFGAVDPDEPTRNIAITPHNLSYTGPNSAYKSTGSVKEICVFCHTPHNATINRALWNRSMPELGAGVSYHMYTTGANLTQTTKGVQKPSDESLMCLSCHDGRFAVNVVHRTRMATGANLDIPTTLYQLELGGYYEDGSDGIVPGLPAPVGIRMGTAGPEPNGNPNMPNLGAIRVWNPDGTPGDTGSLDTQFSGNEFGDDHPISMSYSDVWNERNAGLVAPTDTTRLAQIKFYGGTKMRVECGSCHDPHVTYYYAELGNSADSKFAPFLRKSNAGSGLCLSCHDK